MSKDNTIFLLTNSLAAQFCTRLCFNNCYDIGSLYIQKKVYSVNNSKIIKVLTDNCKFVLKFALYKETEDTVNVSNNTLENEQRIAQVFLIDVVHF